MAVSPKILYLEADEEITSVIDKLRKTEFKKVVLVVPKEASLLQSVVNLKLIKRQAENNEKSIAIVTHDKVGRALAEKLGILASTKLDEVVNEEEFTKTPIENLVPEEPVKQNSSDSPLTETNEVVYRKKSKNQIEEPAPLVVKEDEEKPDEFAKKQIEEPTEENLMPKLPKKKLAIVMSLALLGLLVLGFIFIPRAKATVLVRAERKPVTIDFHGEKDANFDAEKGIIPVQKIEVTKETSKKFTATGKKDAGNKAKGTLTISNVSGLPIDWVAGTRFSPKDNLSLVYRAVNPIHVENKDIVNITVEAAEPGEKYNGFGNNQDFTLTGGGLSTKIIIVSDGSMSGGTTREISFVTQGDINSAKSSLQNEATDEANNEFNKQASELKVIDETKKEEVLSAEATPAVNQEASDFNLAIKVKVSALAYKADDLSNLIKSEVERQLGFSKKVVDDGANEAKVAVENIDKEKVTIDGTIATDAYVSAKFDPEEIKGELVGQNAIKAENYLKGIEGVDETKFDFFPSFLKIFPRIKNNIKLNIEIAGKENL